MSMVSWKNQITILLLTFAVCLSVSTVNAQTDTMVLGIESIGLVEDVVSMPTEVVEIAGKLYRRPVTPQSSVAWLFTSAAPGAGENIVMFGHDFAVFKDLDEVQYGDVATVDYGGTTYKYLITSISTVPNTNISHEERERIGKMLGPQGREVLTLVTCSGRYSESRLVILGELVGNEAH